MYNFKTIDRFVLNLDRLCYADLEVYDAGQAPGGAPKARLFFAAGVVVTLSGPRADAVRDYFARHASPLGPCPAPFPFDVASTAEVATARPADAPPRRRPDPDDFGPVS